MILPKHKSDSEAASRITELNVNEHLDQLGEVMEWCYDPNWPVASDLSPWLASAGKNLLPAITKLDQSQDDNAKYSIINSIIAYVPSSDRPYFYTLLKRWSESPTDSEKREEVNMAAQDLLELWGVE